MKSLIKKINNNRKAFLVYIIITTVVVLLSLLLYKDVIRNVAETPKSILTVKDAAFSGAVSKRIPMVDGKRIEQKISMVSTEWIGFSLYFSGKEEDTTGELGIKLKDSSGNTIDDWTFKSEQLGGEGFYWFCTNSMQTHQGENYYIVIETLSAGEEPLTLMSSTESSDYIHRVIVNGNEEKYSLSYELLNGNNNVLKYFWFLFTICLVSWLVVSYFLIVMRKRKEWVFVIVTFIIGIIYMMVLPPFTVPDEGIHYLTTYAESSKLLGKEMLDEHGKVIMESEAMNFLTREECPNRSTYSKYIRGVLGKDELIELKDKSIREPLIMNHLGYVPQVLGVSLGRIINLNPMQLMYFGRLFGLIWYCFIMFWAIRLIPVFAKNILFVIGMLPMTIQLIISYNYDSVLMGACFFLVAYILFMAYDEHKKKISVKDYFLLLVIILVIVPIKFVYIPLLGLGLLVPKEKFGGKNKKTMVAVGLCVFAILIMLFTRLDVLLNSVTQASAIGVEQHYYTIMDFVHEPVKMFALFLRTIDKNTSFYIESMIGQRMGWLEIYIPTLMSMIAIVLLFLSLLQSSSKVHQWKNSTRLWLIILTGISVLMILFALLTGHTLEGASLIDGVQGRYFIPLLPVILLAMQNQIIVTKKSIDNILLVGINIMHVIVVLNIFSIVASR